MSALAVSSRAVTPEAPIIPGRSHEMFKEDTMSQPQTTQPRPECDSDDPLAGYRERDYEPPEKSAPDPGEEPAAGGQLSQDDEIQAPHS